MIKPDWNYYILIRRPENIFHDSQYTELPDDVYCGSMYYIFYVLNETGIAGSKLYLEWLTESDEACVLSVRSEGTEFRCFESGDCYAYYPREVPGDTLNAYYSSKRSLGFMEDDEILPFLTKDNSFKMKRANLIEIFHTWIAVLENEPLFICFWQDEQGWMHLELFADEISMQQKVDSIKRIVGESDRPDWLCQPAVKD